MNERRSVFHSSLSTAALSTSPSSHLDRHFDALAGAHDDDVDNVAGCGAAYAGGELVFGADGRAVEFDDDVAALEAGDVGGGGGPPPVWVYAPESCRGL